MKLLAKLLFVALAWSANAAEVPCGLKYVKLPKAPPHLADRMKLSTIAQQNWDKYENDYKRLKSYAQFFENLYESSGKQKIYGDIIAEINGIAKSPAWKSVASMQPFKVEHGHKILDRELTAIYQKKFAAENIINHPPVTQVEIVSIPDQLELNMQGMSENEKKFHREQWRSSDALVEAGRQMKASSTQGTYDPKAYSQAKKLFRLEQKLGDFNLNQIKRQAESEGEDVSKWDSDFVPR